MKSDERCKRQQTIDYTLIKQNATKTEIVWALELLLYNYSYRSCGNKSDLALTMFEDNKVAYNFALGKTKCSYVILP